MTDLHHLERQLSRLRDQLAVLGSARPTANELADQDAADHAMAQRIRRARPGVPLHHVYITLQALRAVQELDRPSCPDPIECGHEAALGQAGAAIARVRALAEERQAEAEDGTPTDADTLWPSQVLAALDEPAKD